MKRVLIFLTATVLALPFTSCKEWLDINYDPNAVPTVNNGLILPVIELNMMNVYGFYCHVPASYFAEQWAVMPGGPNTLAQSHWDTTTGTNTANMANNIYRYTDIRIQNNAKIIRDAAAANGQWGDYLAATVMRVFGYQILVDAFGETPYSEALDTKIVAPKYDDGKDVYAGLVAELDEALSKVGATDEVCNNMLFAGSTSVQNWIEFANALKLRILMRESGVVDVKSQLAELVNNNVFPGIDLCYDNCWANQAGKNNPAYETYVRTIGNIKTGRTIDLVAHMALTATMSEVNDQRLAAKFNASVNYNTYEGGFIDEQMSKEITAKYVSANSWAEPKLNYNSPVYLITVAETKFLLAEYYVKFGNDAAKAKQNYQEAIDASFATSRVTGSSAIYATGAKYAWNASKADELIGIQKWIALAGLNGFESWCELRRLGYPAFNSKTGKEIYDVWVAKAKARLDSGASNPTPTAQELIDAGVYTTGTIFTPTYVVGLPINTLLGRLRYVTSSSAVNTNMPEQKDPATKVFWAK